MHVRLGVPPRLDGLRAQAESAGGSPTAEGKRVAVVTGASKGLGLATSMELLSRGFAVCMGIREDESVMLQDMMRLEGFHGDEYAVIPGLDIRSVKSISAATARIGERFPSGIDVLINNAAVSPDGFDYDVRLIISYLHAAFHHRRPA